MRTIYKYELAIADLQTIRTVRDCRVLHAGEQDGQLCLWCMVDTGSPVSAIDVRIVGTGHPAGDLFDVLPGEADWRLVDTVIAKGSALVWHVFVRGPGR